MDFGFDSEGSSMADPKYEFSAPKFHDFFEENGAVPDDNADDWFNTRRVTAAGFSFGDTSRTFGSSMDTDEKSFKNKFISKAKSLKKSVASAFKKPELTVPQTPKCLKKYKNMPKPYIPTTEELTLRKIEEEKERLRRQIEENRENMKKVIAGTEAIQPIHSTKPLTTPEEPHFRLDAKYPPRTQHQPSPPKPAPVFKNPGELTKLEPFTFHTTTSRAPFHVTDSPEPASPYVPLAHKMARFEKSLREPITSPNSEHGHEPTRPQSPVLYTKLRSKPPAIPSTEERELEELQRMPKFKAREVDRKIFESSGEYGVPKVAKPEVTIPEPFEFRTAMRSRPSSRSASPEPVHHFEAKPVNRDIFTRVVGVPEKVLHELTVPESPAITKKRPRLEKEPTPELPTFKAHPMPDFSSPEPLPPREPMPVTKPEPFDLPGEIISKKKKKKMEEELARQEEEEHKRREFKAQPLYLGSPESLPHVERKEVTRPEPFDLASELRGEHYKRLFAMKVLGEEQEAQEAFSSFRSKPADVIHQAPFVPRRSIKPLTDIDTNFTLHSDIRAAEREKFDRYIKEKEQLAEEQENQRKAEEEERERREIAEMRKRMVHHAQPVPEYQQFVVKPSAKELTVPASPMIGHKRKQSIVL